MVGAATLFFRPHYLPQPSVLTVSVPGFAAGVLEYDLDIAVHHPSPCVLSLYLLQANAFSFSFAIFAVFSSWL